MQQKQMNCEPINVTACETTDMFIQKHAFYSIIEKYVLYQIKIPIPNIDKNNCEIKLSKCTKAK